MFEPARAVVHLRGWLTLGQFVTPCHPVSPPPRPRPAAASLGLCRSPTWSRPWAQTHGPGPGHLPRASMTVKLSKRAESHTVIVGALTRRRRAAEGGWTELGGVGRAAGHGAAIRRTRNARSSQLVPCRAMPRPAARRKLVMRALCTPSAPRVSLASASDTNWMPRRDCRGPGSMLSKLDERESTRWDGRRRSASWRAVAG